VIGDPSDTCARKCGTEDVTEEPCEPCSGAGGLLRHEIERMEPDEHDGAVNEKADGDERGNIHPQRAIAVQSIDHQTEQGRNHEQDSRGRTLRLEHFV
jgi:hypothetical protein